MNQNVSSEDGVETILMEQKASSAQKIRQVKKWDGEHLHHHTINVFQLFCLFLFSIRCFFVVNSFSSLLLHSYLASLHPPPPPSLFFILFFC